MFGEKVEVAEWLLNDEPGRVRCFTCGEYHEANYHHLSHLGQGAIFIVTCTDGYDSFYTNEVVER